MREAAVVHAALRTLALAARHPNLASCRASGWFIEAESRTIDDMDHDNRMIRNEEQVFNTIRESKTFWHSFDDRLRCSGFNSPMTASSDRSLDVCQYACAPCAV